MKDKFTVGMDMPGMLALAKAVQEGKWPHTTDAVIWAKEFMERFRDQPPDEADMIAWFANAIMAGYDTAYSQMSKSKNKHIVTDGKKN